MKKRLVVLSGAGISAESGIKTFRDSLEGLWNNYRIEDVCTHTAVLRNLPVVLDFYNNMYEELLTKKPNDAHLILKELEEEFEVTVITQNVDNLHECAGSSKIIHLHGELTKVCSIKDETDMSLVVPRSSLSSPLIKVGDKGKDGAQLRPFIVMFEEAVPMLDSAIKEVMNADIFLIIGTSLAVYPAASLINYVEPNVPVYLIDPNPPKNLGSRVNVIAKGASEGMREFSRVVRDA